MARRTKDESQQTRTAILDAAEIEMQVHGVSGASLHGIARRAQVTRGAIYWHFADKTALIEAMIARTHLPLRDLRECLQRDTASAEPLFLLREMMNFGLERLTADPRHRRVCHIVLHRCEVTEDGHPADTVLRAMFDDARDVLESLCGEIAAAGQLRTGLAVDEAVDIVMAFMCGHYELVLRHGRPDPNRPRWAPRVDALLYGLFEMDRLAPLPAPLADRPTPDLSSIG